MHRMFLRSAVVKSFGMACVKGLGWPVRVQHCICRHPRSAECFTRVVHIQQRFQSSTEKKFHCSICKKSFRLEMAAKLHLQQAHGNDGSVESGPGPGVESVTDIASPQTSAVAPPFSPIEKSSIDEEERRPRRMRPTPKPLHHPDRHVPDLAMDELLGVWDKVGLHRLEGKFVHSTMVMKVFAAKPDDSEQRLYEIITPEGDNPFENVSNAAIIDSLKETYVDEHAFAELDLKGPFAAAPDQTLNPFRAGKVENPFIKNARTLPEMQKVTPQPQQQKQKQVDSVAAPITPFGQLPIFGQRQETREHGGKTTPQPQADESEVASPFEASMPNSPFAGKLVSPPLPSSSPDTSAFAFTEASPFTATSPFTSSAASPFAPLDTPTPFMASNGSAASVAFPMAVSSTEFSVSTQRQEQIVEVKEEHECSTCGKKFSTFEGAAMHSKAKHGIVLQDQRKSKDKRGGSAVPELPAYIPSPVDISSTSPFCSKNTVESSWAETDVIPHAQCMSNITLIGRVLDVTETENRVSQVTIFVQGDKNGDEETITLHCSGDINAQVRNLVKRNAMIFVSGTLRLHPVYEASNNKYYATPVVHVALPAGTLAVIT